jgi:hypothetical protein
MVLAASVTWAGTKEAAEKVREGIASYRSGDYAGAAAAFQEADLARPDDLRIAFDRGVALAAQGDTAKAVELLQKAALAPEVELAARARYNLGCLAAAKARQAFGEHPAKATLEARKEGLADLAQAVGHYRDCLRLDKDHADARHNLEVIRLWIKSMASLWDQADRRKQREDADLPTFLQMLEDKQRALRLAARALARAGDSPKRREAQRTIEAEQSKLGEEIVPLKDKIEATLTKAAAGIAGKSGGSAPAAGADEVKKAIAHLQAMAEETGKSIGAAVGQFRAGKPAEAVKPQTDAVESFNQMYRAVVPYPSLVQRALGTQQALVDGNSPLPSGDGPGKGKLPAKSGPASVSRAEKAANGDASPGSPLDSAEAAWSQEFVTRYSEVLTPLAREGLKQLQAMPADPAASATSPSKPGSGNPAASAEELQKQREGLKRSMDKAVVLAPKVEKLSGEAVGLFRDRKPAEALPKQQEALKLLKEIAEPLPKQKQQQQPNSKDQNKQDQDNQEQKPPDPKQQQQEASQQQTEAALRQVQQRQQKRQEMEKQLQRYLPSSGQVDKDW